MAWFVPDVVVPTETELEVLLAELDALAVDDEVVVLELLDDDESSLDPSSVVVVVVAVPSSSEVLDPVDPEEAALDATVALWARTLNPSTPTAATPATPVIRTRERRMSASRSAPDRRLGSGNSSNGLFSFVFMPGTLAPQPVPRACLPCASPVNWMNASFIQLRWMNATFIQSR